MKQITFLSLIVIAGFLVLTSGIFFEDAFARAGSEFSSPTQQNAYASYNIDTNDVQVSWNFSTLPADTVCFLKGDFVWYEDLNNKHTTGVSGVDYDKVTGFIPLYYSVVSSSPVNVVNGGTSAEVVPCENGSTRINLDAIMSHSLNVNNYKDLEIFLSFYVANADGSLNLADASRIDEVFVMYTSSSTFDTAAQEYGCGGQIGSTLYIDQSVERIHGNNGDNCDGAEFEYVALNSNQWIDIGMDDSPGLSLGVELKGDHVASSFSLLIQIVSQIIASVTSGGADGEHNSKPTFGLDHKTNVQRVDGGLVLNDVTFDVDNNFYTAVPMQYFNIGEMQSFTAKVYASDKLRMMEFFFGIPEVGKWNEAEAIVTFEFNFSGELQKVYGKNLDDIIINLDSLTHSTEKVYCKSTDAYKLCDQISMELSFNEAPIGKVLAMQAIDEKRRSNIVYFNDGITMEGESQNPPTVQKIISEIKHKGLQTIQRIDKENDIWITLDTSEPVLQYQQNESGTFIPIQYRVQEQPIHDEIAMNMARTNSNFNDIIQYEINRATTQFDSQLLQAELGPSWNYKYPLDVDRVDKIKDIIKSEKIKALEVYEKIYTDNEKSKN